jgi:hypothetical protein
MRRPRDTPATEHEILEQVVLACQRALVDYRAGLLAEDEFRDALERAGLELREGSGPEPRAESA